MPIAPPNGATYCLKTILAYEGINAYLCACLLCRKLSRNFTCDHTRFHTHVIKLRRPHLQFDYTEDGFNSYNQFLIEGMSRLKEKFNITELNTYLTMMDKLFYELYCISMIFNHTGVSCFTSNYSCLAELKYNGMDGNLYLSCDFSNLMLLF